MVSHTYSEILTLSESPFLRRHIHTLSLTFNTNKYAHWKPR